MRPGRFRYSRPTSLAGALQAMQAGAIPLAGGQSLLQAMRLRTAEPPAVVDLGAVEELTSDIVLGETALRIGALTTHAMLSEHPAITREFSWLAEAASALGDVQVRNRGTVLGNVCWADPRANMAVALLASDAAVEIADPGASARTERIALAEFFTGFRANALGGKLAIAIEVPRVRPLPVGRYSEFSRQRQDLALVNVCLLAGPAGSRYARVAVGGIHDRPIRLFKLESMIAMRDLAPSALAGEIGALLDTLELAPVEDAYGTLQYKRQLARVLIQRALSACNEDLAHA